MPSRPRGDAKERTFNLLIRDGIESPGNEWERVLIGERPDDENRAFSKDAEIAEQDRRLFGEILEDHFVVEGKGGARFLFPFQRCRRAAQDFRPPCLQWSHWRRC